MATKAKKTYIKDINESTVTAGQKMMFGGLPPDVLEKANIIPTVDKFGNVKFPKEAKVKAIGQYTGGSGDTEAVYSQTYVKDLGTVNGINVYANYDAQGKLTGFDEGRALSTDKAVTKIYENDKQYLRPQWDATGKATPVKGIDTKNGGSLRDFFNEATSTFDDLVLQNPALRAAALAYAMPVLASEVGTATGTSAATGANITKAGVALASGASPEDLAKSYLVNQATGALGSTLDSATATPAATPSGMLSSGADYSTGANYDLTTGQNIGGLGLQGSVGTFNPIDPYSFNVTNTGGEGLTLGDKGYNLANSLTGKPLGEDLAGITTGAEDYLKDTSVDGSKSEATKVAEKLIGKAIMASTTDSTKTSGLGSDSLGTLAAGLLGAGGNLLQGETNQTAREKYAKALETAGTSAASAAQFRPVGTTTRFGTSNYSIDPKTGQLISAGYTPSEVTSGYQKDLGALTSTGLLQGKTVQNLASGYLGETPAAVRQRYIDQQNAVLAPGQEQQLAGIRQNLFNTGRQGLAFGATSAGGLSATNPEMAAYYNSLANQQRQIAAGADVAAQNQAKFGADLAAGAFAPFNAGFGAQSSVEKAAQQPMTLSTDLAAQFQKASQQGGAYNLEAQKAAAQTMFPANQYNPLAQLLSGSSTNPNVAALLKDPKILQYIKSLGGVDTSTWDGSTGLDTSNIDYNYLSTIYANNNPFEGVLNTGETWAGE